MAASVVIALLSVGVVVHAIFSSHCVMISSVCVDQQYSLLGSTSFHNTIGMKASPRVQHYIDNRMLHVPSSTHVM